MNMMMDPVSSKARRRVDLDVPQRQSVSDGPRYRMDSVAIPGIRMLAIDQAAAGDCVDRIGHLSAIIAQLEAARKALQATVIDHAVTTRAPKVKGKTFQASVVLAPAPRISLDTAAIRADMGDDWCAPYERSSAIGPYIARVGAL